MVTTVKAPLTTEELEDKIRDAQVPICRHCGVPIICTLWSGKIDWRHVGGDFTCRGLERPNVGGITVAYVAAPAQEVVL